MTWRKVKNQLAAWKSQVMATHNPSRANPQQALLKEMRPFKTNYASYVLNELAQAENLVAQLEKLQMQLEPCQHTVEHLCTQLLAKLGKLQARFNQERNISPPIRQQRSERQAALIQHQQWQAQLQTKIKHIETQLAQTKAPQEIARLEALLIVTEQRLARCIDATNKLQP